MNALIKTIRSYIGISQQEFADKLGVTFATVNRWENAKAVPNKLAQDKLYDFCKELGIPVYEMILERINREVKQITISSNHIILYHGSKLGIKGDIAPVSRPKCDFGQGFYMGTEPIQPLTLICDYEKSRFYIVSLNLDELKVLDIPSDLEWAMIVAYNRKKMESIKDTNLYKKYQNALKDKDVVIGSIANDRMFYVLDNFFLGNISDLALLNSLSALQLGKQYVAISKKACEAIKIEKEIAISYLERRFLKDISEENRIKGVSLANDICKNYRRTGRFFDEIILDAKEK